MSTDLPTYVETLDLEEGFYTGAGVREPEETAFPLALEGVGFLLDTSQHRSLYDRFQCSPINLTNSQQANSGGDQAQTAPEMFRRPVETWDSGSGQLRHDRETSDPGRYADSYRVDVWTPWKASLLPDTTLVQSLGSGTAFLAVVAQTWLVAVDGVDMYWFTDLTSAPTHVVMSGPALAVTTDGALLYVLETSGIVRTWTDPVTAPGTWIDLTGYGPTAFDGARPLLAYSAGFLIAACGPDLLDITTGSATRIWLHPLDVWTWRDCVDGLNGTYLLGGAGDRWNIMVMTLKDDATTFNPPSLSAPLPAGEVGRALFAYLGYLLIGTDAGWRFAQTDGSGKANYGRLVISKTPVLCFTGSDRFVWFGMNGDTTATTAGLGRADLETFVAVLTPASAPDLSTPVTVGQVTAVATFAGKRVFAVEGSGVWAQTDDLAPDGWLTQGNLSFASSDTKHGLYAEVFHAPLAGRIDIAASYDDGGFGQIGTSRGQDVVSSGHLNLDHDFKNVQLRYTLTRDPTITTQGPALTRAEVRAIVVHGKAREWRLPLVVRQSVAYDSATVHLDVAARLDHLESLYESKRQFDLRIYSRHYQVYMNDFLVLAENPTPPSTGGQDLQCVWIAVVREVV